MFKRCRVFILSLENVGATLSLVIFVKRLVVTEVKLELICDFIKLGSRRRRSPKDYEVDEVLGALRYVESKSRIAYCQTFVAIL